MTNPQIQARLQRAYQKYVKEEERFKEHLKQGEKPVITEPELCYVPEFKEGEKYLFLDERKGFQADKTYLKLKEECNVALSSIRDDRGNFILNKESTLAFFDSFYPLYKELFLSVELSSISPFSPFVLLPHRLERILLNG